MTVTKTINIDGIDTTFRASAAIPRIYRIKFGRDIYKDLRSLEKSVGDGDEENSNLDMFVESHNDEYNYPAVATQEQMDRF